jgi:hypothetical protein
MNLSSANQYTCTISSRWDGSVLPLDDQIFITIESLEENLPEPVLVISVDAPFYDDPVPRCDTDDACENNSLNFDGLWNYEVVEVFIKGKLDKYIEIEMGPHGHYLLLALDGYRHCFKRKIEPISYEAKISGARWIGKLVAPIHILPPPTGIPEAMFSFNAYGIHEGPESPNNDSDTRVYCCAFPPAKPGGDYLVPDFHKLELFQRLDTLLSSGSGPVWSGRQELCIDFPSPRIAPSVPKQDGEESSSPTLRE